VCGQRFQRLGRMGRGDLESVLEQKMKISRLVCLHGGEV